MRKRGREEEEEGEGVGEGEGQGLNKQVSRVANTGELFLQRAEWPQVGGSLRK